MTIDYVGVNGTDGKEFDTSYGKDQATFTLDADGVIKGFGHGLDGVPVGSRVLHRGARPGRRTAPPGVRPPASGRPTPCCS